MVWELGKTLVALQTYPTIRERQCSETQVTTFPRKDARSKTLTALWRGRNFPWINFIAFDSFGLETTLPHRRSKSVALLKFQDLERFASQSMHGAVAIA